MTYASDRLAEVKKMKKSGFNFEETWDELIKYLQESEQQVLELIQYLKGTIPKYTPKGSIEFGFMLYWLDYPPADVQKILNDEPFLGYLWKLIADVAPKTKITTADYAYLESMIKKLGGVPGPDGTLIGYSKFEEMDANWVYAPLNFAMNKLFGARTSFGTNPYVKPLSNLNNGTARIAIIGDWGTGNWNDNGRTCPAVDIINQVKAINPTHVIHLGDVYYAGTDYRPPPGEEQANFLNLWWGPNAPATSFTLNSNHEMYGDGSGYFDVALKPGGPFQHQSQTSFFVLTLGDWVILGLDSALCSESMYMDGRLGNNTNMDQINFLRKLNLSGKRVIVLTHHNGTDFTSTTRNQLWKDLNYALNGRSPDFWYWGHVHNGVAYNNKSAAGSTFARCTGHAAIPFGNAWSLEDTAVKPKIDYYADTKSPAGPARVLNGFTVLELSQNMLLEVFLEQGNPNAVWGLLHTYLKDGTSTVEPATL